MAEVSREQSARRRQSADRQHRDKQERSVERYSKLLQAATTVVAKHGLIGLSHRLVAGEAGLPLAATTYYFRNKFDIIAEASDATLNKYIEAFNRTADRLEAAPYDPAALAALATRLVRNTAGPERLGALCWAEVTFDAPRHAETLAAARRWFSACEAIWHRIATHAGMNEPGLVARSSVDALVGLVLMALGLGLSEAQIDAVMRGGADPLEAWAVRTLPPAAEVNRPHTSQKAAITRDRLLKAAIDILVREGPGYVNNRSVAKAANLSAGSPFYYFDTVEALISAAQSVLFEEAKERYRRASAGLEPESSDTNRVIDRTTTIFVREATEFARRNLASYSIWLQAARSPDLRPIVWNAIADQQREWQRLLARIAPRTTAFDALLAQAVFIGKLVRLLATGSALEDLERARAEFAYILRALTEGSFWMQPATATD